MSLAAGRLRHRVTFLALTTGYDPNTGENVGEMYAPWAVDVPAEVAPLSAREFVAAQAGQAQVVVRITIRYRPGVVPTMRIEFRDKTYNVEGVLPDPDSGLEYLTLACSEVIGDAG